MSTEEIVGIIDAALREADSRPRHLRYGQAFFNGLPPAMKEALRATPEDPFYKDSKVDRAIARLHELFAGEDK